MATEFRHGHRIRGVSIGNLAAQPGPLGEHTAVARVSLLLEDGRAMGTLEFAMLSPESQRILGTLFESIEEDINRALDRDGTELE